VDSGEVRYVSIKRQDVKYRVFGDTVLVHAVTSIHGHTSGRDVELVLRLLNVWVKENGEWRLAAIQGNEMPKN
jgi:ketosteroid isomerase-like protein